VASLLFSPCTSLSSTNKNDRQGKITWGTLVSSTNKNDRQDITEILLKVALNTIMITPNSLIIHGYSIVIVEVKESFLFY
jgi:hypothetical protein